MLGISIMTQRSERWLIVGACLVLYLLAMGAFVLITRQPVRWAVDWLIAYFGLAGGACVMAAPIIAAGIWAYWPDPSYTPPPAPNTRFPRWVRIIGNLYLAAIAFCMVAGMGTFIAVSLTR